MQFPVPQFIDVEDKIIGPLTLKQFGFVAGGGVIILLFFKLIGVGVFFYILSLPVACLSLILAFASFNGRKLYDFLPVMLNFFRSDKVLVFQQRSSGEQINIKPIGEETLAVFNKNKENAAAASVPEESVQSRLRRIALQLDQKNSEEVDVIKTIRKQNAKR